MKPIVHFQRLVRSKNSAFVTSTHHWPVVDLVATCQNSHVPTGAAFRRQAQLPCQLRIFSSLAVDELDSGNQKTIPFLLADIGEGIAEVEMLRWFVQTGDNVAQFDKVCEVQSDKATVEITSRFDGIVDSLGGQIGDMISVGSPLLYITVAGESGCDNDVDESDKIHDSQSTPIQSTRNRLNSEEGKFCVRSRAKNASLLNGDASIDPTGTGTQLLATPAVRKLGMEYNIDMGTICGSGPKGRVLKADVMQFIREEESRAKGGISLPASSIQRAMPQRSPHSSNEPSVVSGEDVVVPIRGYQRLMVNTMIKSQEVPHMCYSDEVNINALRTCREDLKPLAESHGVRLSYLPFLIKAASLAITNFPVLNSSINVDDLIMTYHCDHNIGIAVDTPRGLAVPVVKHCQELSVLEIAKELSRLQNAAIEGRLEEKDIVDATFAMSNIGSIGGTYMSPIIAPPQVAIGAMGRIQRLPRFVGETNEVESAHIMQISWSGDHRAVDGATMARFSNQWKAFVERPMSMTFNMK